MNAMLGPGGEPTQRLLEEVRAALGVGAGAGEDLRPRVLRVVAALAPVRGHAELERVGTWVLDRLTGLGPLQELADQPGVSDVLVTAGGEVWVDGVGGLKLAPIRLPVEEERRRLAVRLLSLGGRRLDDAAPCADAVVAGVRVHAVLPPISQGGTVLSLRVLSRNAASLAQLFPEPADPWRGWLEHAVRRRMNVMVSGGTGAGKTTLVSALLGAADPQDRIVLVEDASELAPHHPHVVALQSRPPNAEGRGGVDLGELVRQALRMRPDRLVVGECRSAEVADLLMALNTGHDGAAGTLHANSVEDVPARLIALGALAGWDERTTALHAAAALDVVVHMRRDGAGRRPVALARLVHAAGSLAVDPIVVLGADGVARPGPSFGWFVEHRRGEATP